MRKPKSSPLILNEEWESHVWDLLFSQFGILKLKGYRFLQSGKKRIRLISKTASTLLHEVPYTGSTGLYVGEYSPRAVRLTMDGAMLLGPAEQAKDWMQGESINYENKLRGYVIVYHKEDILGCGSLSQGILHSFVPKTRRPKHP
ncbi:MAG: methyltransferase RsmF C-terminal domain-like protein [Candidatus Hermodarchaeia archaeon]|jgi:NOL1/NOP2/fmu family ribosome biogenesis protein